MQKDAKYSVSPQILQKFSNDSQSPRLNIRALITSTLKALGPKVIPLVAQRHNTDQAATKGIRYHPNGSAGPL